MKYQIVGKGHGVSESLDPNGRKMPEQAIVYDYQLKPAEDVEGHKLLMLMRTTLDFPLGSTIDVAKVADYVEPPPKEEPKYDLGPEPSK